MTRALALCLLLWVGIARADEDAPPTLDQRVLALRSESAESRRASLLALLETDGASLDAVRAYLREAAAASRAATAPSKPGALLEKLAQIRGEDAKDLPSALLAALARDRSPAMVQAVALSALLRALERQHSIDASTLIVSELFAVAPAVFRGEAARTRKRLGKLLAPGWVAARASEDPALQKLAKDGLKALGYSTPQRLYGDPSDPELTAAILRAAGDALATDALPWLVAYLDDPRANVRAEARRATLQFEGKAADLLRVRLTELTHEAPDPQLGAPELLAQIVAHEERVRTEPARAALAQAERLLAKKTELDRAARLLDQALTVGLPSADAARLARAYLALGAQRDQQNLRVPALSAFRRALRADPEGPHAKQARARVLYLQAEDRLGDGIVEAHALRTSLALDPQQPAAKQLVERLERARERSPLPLRTYLGYGAAGLLLIAAFLTLRVRRPQPA